MRPLALRRPARAEFDKAIDWYERQREGLGVEFAGQVQAAFDRIASDPELHALTYRDVRKAPVQEFPYSVFYRFRSNRVVVLAVFHNKRNPDLWRSRA